MTCCLVSGSLADLSKLSHVVNTKVPLSGSECGGCDDTKEKEKERRPGKEGGGDWLAFTWMVNFNTLQYILSSSTLLISSGLDLRPQAARLWKENGGKANGNVLAPGGESGFGGEATETQKRKRVQSVETQPRGST